MNTNNRTTNNNDNTNNHHSHHTSNIDPTNMYVKCDNILDTIDELTTFVAKKQSFEADDGHTDDLVMTLVLFAWLTRQEYFKDITNTDVRTSIYQEKIEKLEEDMSPFGFMPDSEEDAGEWDGESRWFTTENNPSW